MPGSRCDMASSDASFWSSDTIEGGYLHRANVASVSAPRHYPLIVFVHGYTGGPLETWGNLPQWVLRQAGLDTDVLTYAYPASPWQRASVEFASQRLRHLLNESFPEYQHLFFVTHSTG